MAAYSNREGLLFNGQSLAANANSEPLESRYFNLVALQLVWSGADAADGVVKFQWSNNKTNWDDIPSSSTTLSTASGSATINVPDLGPALIRANLAKGTNTVGSVTVYYMAKSFH